MRMQSTNPMLRESVLQSSAREAATLDASKQMSLEGTMSKTCILMFLALMTVIGVLISDILLGILDPRIRLSGGSSK